MSLSSSQITHYRSQGWIAPLDVMSADEAAALATTLREAEESFPGQLHAEHRNNAHLAFPFLAELVAHPTIVSAAASLVGPDLTLSSTVLFIKEPDSTPFVSWHQDALYMGLEPANFVTAWLALTPSTIESGCVSVIPGSHHTRHEHRDTFGDDNILTRGQEAVNVDESASVHLELQPGQMSLHHPWLIHGSQPNRSATRRVGVAMQSYLGADVRPSRGKHHVLHICGAPVANSFVEATTPAEACSEAAIAIRRSANDALAAVLYDGAERRRAL